MLATHLTQRAEAGADAAQVADAVVAAWREIDAVLGPVLGRRSVVTLYKRCLVLTVHDHPWLAPNNASAAEIADAGMDLAALRSALAQRESADAAAGGGALLQALHDLLTSLVGPSLTERLLGAVWADAASEAPAREPST